MAKILDNLRSQGAEFVPLDELMESLAKSSRHSLVAITLDDGYLDNLSVALPVFEAYSAPFTVYVTTGLIDGTADPWWYSLQSLVLNNEAITVPGTPSPSPLPTGNWKEQESAYRALYRFVGEAGANRPAALAEIWRANGLESPPDNGRLFMSWDEIRQLDQSPLATVGAHTVTHPRLSWLEPDGIRSELEQSRLRLEAELGHPIKHVAYPHGSERDLPHGISDLAKAAGFETGTTTIPRNLSPGDLRVPWTLPRKAIPGEIEDLELMNRFLGGWDDWFNPRLRRRLAQTKE
ncbi:MAG: polysaccharide deacetylase family protein, partial [Verrucomicrobiae bacterium]|nr:polysaccharide deacetylase family protein [Verrucomicrobiae bacterium]